LFSAVRNGTRTFRTRGQTPIINIRPCLHRNDYKCSRFELGTRNYRLPFRPLANDRYDLCESRGDSAKFQMHRCRNDR
jgi:hypothetical protein